MKMSIKQANFRIEESDANNFRRFCEENGFNQAQGFDHIMQVLELNKAKEVTPGRATEIEEFERSTKALLSAYLNSLELNNNAELRIQERFETDLKAKDKTIADLQQKMEALQIEKDTAVSDAKESAEIRDQLSARYDLLKKQQDTSAQLIHEKENVIISLTDRNRKLSEKVEFCDKLEEQTADLTKKNDDLIKEIADLKKDFAIQKKELTAEMDRKVSDAKKDSDLAVANAVAKKERELMKRITALEIEKAKLEAKIED